MELSDRELRENYDHFDRDGDGKLERNEFGELMTALDAVEPGGDPAFGFGEIDTDDSGVIEFDEFAAWFRNR